MGEVYLAHDTQLRLVAPATAGAFTQDEDRLRRFEQRPMPPALNHPNILAIYEIGQIDSGRAIAMGYGWRDPETAHFAIAASSPHEGKWGSETSLGKH